MPMQRIKIALGGLFSVVLLVSLPACARTGLFEMNDDLRIEISIIDQDQNPVPYATIGMIFEPNPIAGKRNQFVSKDTLQDRLTRFRGSWEYWNDFVEFELYLDYIGLSNSEGFSESSFDYGGSQGGDRPARPDGLSFHFAVAKDGYEPRIVTARADKSDDKLSLEVVLTRVIDAPAPEYLRTLNEVRYELNDSDRNAGVSRDNYERLEALKLRLRKAADTAIAANDREAAARIMYWVAFIPRILVNRDGDLVGYEQLNWRSEETWRALSEAAKLDPENDHIVSVWYVANSDYLARKLHAENDKSEWAERRKEALKIAWRIDQRAGDNLWPMFHDEMLADLSFFRCYRYAAEKAKWLINTYSTQFTRENTFINLYERYLAEGKAKDCSFLDQL